MNYFLRPLLGCTALFCLTALVRGEDFYVAQTALKSDTGADAANAHSRAWFENSANWGAGAGKISPGDTVHLVGTLTGLSAQGSGAAGNPITILFEPGAKLSSPNTDLMYVGGLSYLVIDGGTNGIIENTANGTALANHTPGVKGINVTGCSNITIKNLTIRNLYVHTSVNDSALDFTTGGGVYANGYGAGMVIQNCSFSDICWCVIMFGSPTGNLTVANCNFVNYDHGIGGVAGTSGPVTGFTATGNHFGSTVNWDTTANSYHHDGIHTFWGNGGALPNAVITNNLFDGDWGTHNTAHLFFEQNYNTHSPAEASGWIIANNVHIQYPSNYLNNGFMVAIGNNATIANNTYIGSSVALSQALSVTGTGAVFENNLIVGVNRFVDAASPFAVINNNIYASVVGSGNTPFRFKGSDVASFAAWKSATGGESASQMLSSIAINNDGTLPSGSAAIDAGTTVAASLATDRLGASRLQGNAWDVGAYEFSSGGTSIVPPSNAKVSITVP